MQLNHAKTIADEIIQHLQPHCQRITVVGEVRREKDVCKKIEILCIPKGCKVVWSKSGDLFGGNEYSFQYTRYSQEFIKALAAYPIVKGHANGTHCSINYVGCIVDVFMCCPENFGYWLAAYTGPKSLANRLVINLQHKGFVCKEGWIYKDGVPGECTDESHVFALAGMNFYEPKYRK